jgi:hypothetical protein
VSELRHRAVPHPRDLLARHPGRAAGVNDWLATRLAAVFGLVWTIWVFFTTPILVQFFPKAVQAHFFFYASGWVQLFALPLLVYVGNRVQKSSDAQSDAQHQALTHIASVGDDVKSLIEANTELTRQVHALVSAKGGTP